MLDLCEYENHTYIILDNKIPSIQALNGNRIVGIIGSCLDRILCPIFKRKCTIIGGEDLGKKYQNGSYSGILGLLQSNRADLFLKGEPDLLNEPFLLNSLPLKTESLIIGHNIVTKEEKHVEYFDLIYNLNLGRDVMIGYFFVVVSILLIGLLLSRLSIKRPTRFFYNKNIFSRIELLFERLLIKKNYPFKFFLLSVSIFMFFTVIFMSMSIKTNKIVVDTSHLLKDRNHLLNTKMSICFSRSTDLNLALLAPKTSLLFRIFHEKAKLKPDQIMEKTIIKKDHCILSRDNPETLKILEKNAFISTEVEYSGLLTLLSMFKYFKKYWLLTTGVQNFNLVLYGNNRNKINKIVQKPWSFWLSENGLYKQIDNCIKSTSQKYYKWKMDVYVSLEEYVDEHMNDTSNLAVGNFHTLLAVFFFVNSTWLLTFLISKFSKTIKRNLKNFVNSLTIF